MVPWGATISTSQSILGQLFLRPEFCVEAVCTDGLDENYGRIDGELSLSAAVSRRATASPLTAGLLGRWLAVESVVRWPIRGDGPTRREGRPRNSSNHIDELLVRPPPEATPASAGRRHILVVKVPPDVL